MDPDPANQIITDLYGSGSPTLIAGASKPFLVSKTSSDGKPRAPSRRREDKIT
jgi:hypothetical protein